MCRSRWCDSRAHLNHVFNCLHHTTRSNVCRCLVPGTSGGGNVNDVSCVLWRSTEVQLSPVSPAADLPWTGVNQPPERDRSLNLGDRPFKESCVSTKVFLRNMGSSVFCSQSTVLQHDVVVTTSTVLVRAPTVLVRGPTVLVRGPTVLVRDSSSTRVGRLRSAAMVQRFAATR